MKIDWSRVSTDGQDTAVQVAALKSAGCERIYRQKSSGASADAARSFPINNSPRFKR